MLVCFSHVFATSIQVISKRRMRQHSIFLHQRLLCASVLCGTAPSQPRWVCTTMGRCSRSPWLPATFFLYCGHRASRARRPRCLTVSFTILDFGICTSDMVTWCSIPRSLSTRFFFQAKRPFQSLPQHVFYQLNQILKAISPWFTRTFTNLIHRLCCRGVGAITKVIYRRICPARGPSCKPSHLWWCHNTVDGRNPANQLI